MLAAITCKLFTQLADQLADPYFIGVQVNLTGKDYTSLSLM